MQSQASPFRLSLPLSIMGCLWLAACATPDSVRAATLSRPVGFVRVQVPAGARVAASIPFHPFDESIQAVFHTQLSAPSTATGLVRVLKWDTARQDYVTAVKLCGPPEVPPGDTWLADPDEGIPSDMTLSIGEGFWIENLTDRDAEVLLWGRIALADARTQILGPGLTLFGCPYATHCPLDTEGLLLPGPADGEAGDSLSRYVGDRYEFAVRTEGGIRWETPSGPTPAAFDMGAGYFYTRSTAEPLEWLQLRPYPSVFPTSVLPRVAGMRLADGGGAVVLSIETEEGAQGLSVFYRDLAPDDVFDPAAGWRVAAAQLAVAGETALEWTDSGSEDRPPPATAFARLYVVVRTDLDLDENALPDGWELPGVERAGTGAVEMAETRTWMLSFLVTGSPGDDLSLSNLLVRPALTGSGRVIYVDRRNGDDRLTGRARFAVDAAQGPKRTVTGGLRAAQPGDRIVIAEGHYREDLNIAGRDIVVTVEGTVVLAGRRLTPASGPPFRFAQESIAGATQ